MRKVEIVDYLLDSIDRQGSAQLVVVVATEGSAARGAGAWLAVRPDGGFFGTVGGGALEQLVLKGARELVAARASRLVRYSVGGGSSDTGMVCGGAVELCFAHVDAGAVPVLQRERATLMARGMGVLAIDLAPFGGALAAGEHGAAAARTVEGPLTLAFEQRDDQLELHAGIYGDRYLEPVSPEGFTYVFGCGHVGAAVVPVLARAGFAVIACDDRPDFLGEERLPDAEERRLVDYGHLDRTCSIGPRDLVVSCTPAHKSDLEILIQALRCRPGYIGCLGSAKKTAFVLERLLREGFSEDEVARVRMPIGVPIACETPEEIAVSIAAQMIDYRCKAGDGSRAADLSAKLHAL